MLGVPDQAGMEPLDAVVDHLKGQQLLIVLDTCEHMIDACAVLCDVLLREAAEVCVLATSFYSPSTWPTSGRCRSRRSEWTTPWNCSRSGPPAC